MRRRSRRCRRNLRHPVRLRDARIALALYAAAGGVALGYEVVWSELLVQFLSTRSYAFAVMLATYLSGLALGSFLFARLGARGHDPWRFARRPAGRRGRERAGDRHAAGSVAARRPDLRGDVGDARDGTRDRRGRGALRGGRSRGAARAHDVPRRGLPGCRPADRERAPRRPGRRDDPRVEHRRWDRGHAPHRLRSRAVVRARPLARTAWPSRGAARCASRC